MLRNRPHTGNEQTLLGEWTPGVVQHASIADYRDFHAGYTRMGATEVAKAEELALLIASLQQKAELPTCSWSPLTCNSSPRQTQQSCVEDDLYMCLMADGLETLANRSDCSSTQSSIPSPLLPALSDNAAIPDEWKYSEGHPPMLPEHRTGGPSCFYQPSLNGMPHSHPSPSSSLAGSSVSSTSGEFRSIGQVMDPQPVQATVTAPGFASQYRPPMDQSRYHTQNWFPYC